MTTTNAIELGRVYTIGNGRRRYLAVASATFPGGGQTFDLVALSGEERGSHPTGARAEDLVLARDQAVRFEGKIATRQAAIARSSIVHYSREAERATGAIRYAAAPLASIENAPVIQGATR